MNRGHVLQSFPMQQLMAGNPNWLPSSSSSLVFPHYLPPPSFSVHPWNDTQDLPESWSQLLLGGIVGEEDRLGPNEYHQEQVLYSTSSADIKQEISENTGYAYSHGNEEFQSNWSHVIAAASSPKSSTVSSNNMLDFSNNKASQQQQPEHSSECNSSTASGGAFKKARIQPSSTTTTFKVRKEKLGDRITALHQLVSPFGKTDTASVLLEAIGYIRFLQNQIEALSTPYLGNGSANMRQQQQSVQGEKNCIFPEDPGQLLNDNCLKRKGAPDQVSENEPRTDLKSRGLCLVPVSCTLQVGSDNGADYWAPTLGGGFR